jgi:hypothetical protein
MSVATEVAALARAVTWAVGVRRTVRGRTARRGSRSREEAALARSIDRFDLERREQERNRRHPRDGSLLGA